MKENETTTKDTATRAPRWRAKQVAEYLGVNTQTIYKRAREGKIPHYKLPYIGGIFFDSEEIKRFAVSMYCPVQDEEAQAAEYILTN